METQMTISTWNDSFSLGVDYIDLQFKELFSIYDELLEVKDNSRFQSPENVGIVISRLKQAAEKMANIDNILINNQDLRELDGYVVNTQKLLVKIDNFIVHYNSRSPMLLFEMTEFLKRWLMSQLWQSRKVFLN